MPQTDPLSKIGDSNAIRERVISADSRLRSTGGSVSIKTLHALVPNPNRKQR
jgi:hypothetical protein